MIGSLKVSPHFLNGGPLILADNPESKWNVRNKDILRGKREDNLLKICKLRFIGEDEVWEMF